MLIIRPYCELQIGDHVLEEPLVLVAKFVSHFCIENGIAKKNYSIFGTDHKI
ncbi:MAG: hypothetical protein WCI71_19950 [Bacteroidota bacterium]